MGDADGARKTIRKERMTHVSPRAIFMSANTIALAIVFVVDFDRIREMDPDPIQAVFQDFFCRLQ